MESGTLFMLVSVLCYTVWFSSPTGIRDIWGVARLMAPLRLAQTLSSSSVVRLLLLELLSVRLSSALGVPIVSCILSSALTLDHSG